MILLRFSVSQLPESRPQGNSPSVHQSRVGLANRTSERDASTSRAI
jgi:hypothetical protein